MKKFSVMLLVGLLLCGSAFAYNWGNADLVDMLKYAFSTSTGHDHDGSNSKVVTVGGITSGTINGAIIGGSTPAAATVTTATVNSTLGVTGAATFSSTVNGPGGGNNSYTIRVRNTIAEVNAGKTLLAAVTGRKYRLSNVEMIAIGGAVTSTNATHVEIRGTQAAGAVVLYKVAKAQLTQSAINQFGTTSTIVLADGASLLACDANTAITINPLTGTDFAGASNIDVILTYSIE